MRRQGSALTQHLEQPADTADGRVVVIGAGPTGLGFAYRWKELGLPVPRIFDAGHSVGGLARSELDPKGFTWDIGGHVQFSHYRYFDDLMTRALGDGWLRHERESWVRIEERFVPYPFQNNIRHLSRETMWRCLAGLVDLHKNPLSRRPRHFAEWIDATFGSGLAEVFMRPYNFKVWAHPLESMDAGWVGERVAVTDLTRVLDNIINEKDDISWGPNNQFQFPLRGGTGAIWERVADLVGREHITLNAAAVHIDTDKRVVEFSNGETVTYGTLISTIPIDELVDVAKLCGVREAAQKLRYSTSHIIGVGLTGKPPDSLAKKCWMYFPESNCPFYRVTVFSNYSPNNVPDINQYWSLMAEVSESSHKPVDPNRVVADTIQGMRNTGLIDDDHQIASTWYHRAQRGYPIPTVGRDAALDAIHPELEKRGIYSRGRFGGWKYEVSNQDHSLMQGVELASRLACGTPEVTYWFPNTANDLRYGKR